MIVAHINRDMAIAIMPAIIIMIKQDAAKGGARVPLSHDDSPDEWSKLSKSITPTTQAWIDCMGEFGYRLLLDSLRFVRPV